MVDDALSRMMPLPSKPIALVVTVAPALAAADVVVAVQNGLSWYQALGLFYLALAIAELTYLAVVFRSGAVLGGAEPRRTKHPQRFSS